MGTRVGEMSPQVFAERYGTGAPMLLGKVELDNGQWITGFGCDHAAPAQGRDITEYRGWLAAMS
ncbi:hypothetical protein M2272_003689 [Mycobacterium frederiksbergense]|uniref:Allophanate hydrolase C-terminal domain-containing protein n=2 Tax=Mycolicibacterium frederiksbergense TaxID=117567 RepID=A0ABT6L275_9MYCO|nr:hypothetical protein [Mycolicibacterium frederiksbergense]